MRTKIIILLCILNILCACQIVPEASPVSVQTEPESNSASTNQEPAGPFGIYLTPAYIRNEELADSGLDCGRVADEPLLSAADILSYDWEMHQIQVTHEAYQRLSRLEVPVSGLPFVTCVGRHPVYSGALWTMLSSASFEGVVILFPLLEPDSLQIELGYPGPDFFQGNDPRSDPQIHESLSQAGKLK
jgi:hypothetical protein